MPTRAQEYAAARAIRRMVRGPGRPSARRIARTALAAAALVAEDGGAYRVGVMFDLERELISAEDRRGLARGPLWTRLLVANLVKRIANLRQGRSA